MENGMITVTRSLTKSELAEIIFQQINL
jgi:hypothetical protein